MSSTRLPGKVLADVMGEPLLALLLRRLARARTLDSITVATSDRREDDPIGTVARAAGARVHRGPLEDVLGRMLGACEPAAGCMVRITADCPLVDASNLDDVVELFWTTPGCDYASNIEPRVVPDGCDVEVVNLAALRHLAATERERAVREHVTLPFRRSGGRWIRASLPAPAGPSLAELCWTVDEPEDLEFLRAVVERMGARRYVAGIAETRRLVIAEPSLARFGSQPRA